MHASAQLKVIISGGFSAPYQQLLPEFERRSGTKVTTGSGASQGTGPQTIGVQLARGVPADVVILSREGLKRTDRGEPDRRRNGRGPGASAAWRGRARRGRKARRQHRRSVQADL